MRWEAYDPLCMPELSREQALFLRLSCYNIGQVQQPVDYLLVAILERAWHRVFNQRRGNSFLVVFRFGRKGSVEMVEHAGQLLLIENKRKTNHTLGATASLMPALSRNPVKSSMFFASLRKSSSSSIAVLSTDATTSHHNNQRDRKHPRQSGNPTHPRLDPRSTDGRLFIRKYSLTRVTQQLFRSSRFQIMVVRSAFFLLSAARNGVISLVTRLMRLMLLTHIHRKHERHPDRNQRVSTAARVCTKHDAGHTPPRVGRMAFFGHLMSLAIAAKEVLPSSGCKISSSLSCSFIRVMRRTEKIGGRGGRRSSSRKDKRGRGRKRERTKISAQLPHSGDEGSAMLRSAGRQGMHAGGRHGLVLDVQHKRRGSSQRINKEKQVAQNKGRPNT